MMYPYINAGQSRRALTTHDKNGVKTLYSYPAV